MIFRILDNNTHQVLESPIIKGPGWEEGLVGCNRSQGGRAKPIVEDVRRFRLI